MHDRTAARKDIPAPSPAAPHPLAFAALLAGNVALAFGPWFVRVTDVGPVAAAFWRVSLALPVLALLAAASGARPRPLGAGLILAIALAGVSFAADLGSWHVGIRHTTLANATLLGNSATLIYPLWGFFVARAWPTRLQGAALLLATAGAALLMGRSLSIGPEHLLGDALSLFAGVLYTVYFVLMAQARATMAPLPALVLATAAATLPLLACALLLGEPVVPQRWTPLIGLALCSQVIGQGLMIYALPLLSPLVVGVALLTQPVVAGAIGWYAYGERPGALDLVGAAMVAVALVLVRDGSTSLDKRASRANLAPEEPR